MRVCSSAKWTPSGWPNKPSNAATVGAAAAPGRSLAAAQSAHIPRRAWWAPLSATGDGGGDAGGNGGGGGGGGDGDGDGGDDDDTNSDDALLNWEGVKASVGAQAAETLPKDMRVLAFEGGGLRKGALDRMLAIKSVRLDTPVLVKHGPHVSCFRARERAKPHWKSGLSTSFLEHSHRLFCARARIFHVLRVHV